MEWSITISLIKGWMNKFGFGRHQLTVYASLSQAVMLVADRLYAYRLCDVVTSFCRLASEINDRM